MRFEFATAARVLFGPGALRELGPAAAEFAGGAGRRVLVANGLPVERARPAIALLADAGLASTTLAVEGEPTTDLVERGAEQARAEGCTLVIGLGGGSAVDAAKAVAAMAANEGRLLDYLEVIGENRPLPRPPLPCIAVPTTAGTGAEVTRNAVLASPAHHVKVSLRSPLMLPRVALVDPELTLDLPPAVTASTGLDALTQLIEAFVSAKANPMTDGLCREGIVRAAASLLKASRDGHDLAARTDLSLASLFSGMALANAGLGAVHGFAGPIGGMFAAPHGAVCAALLPEVMEANIRALRARRPDSPALARYVEVARMLTGDVNAGAEDGIRWVAVLRRELNIPRLSTLGLTPADVPTVVEKAQAASSMKGNPVTLTAGELTAILERAG